MSVSYRFLEPLDVLFLRGNKLFGEPGSHGESLIPPWPSVAAGAIRSRILVDDGFDPSAFARGEQVHPQLGTPAEPGSFVLRDFQLARRDAGGVVTALMPPPADLVISESGDGGFEVRRLRPVPRPALASGAAILDSSPLPLLPALAQAQRSKPVSGLWLTEPGWREYLRGDTPAPDTLVRQSELWAMDPRIGVGLDPLQRRAADGKLFSMQAIALHPAVGFLAGVEGASPASSGTLRLGGDGRAARLESIAYDCPEPDYGAIAAAGRCRLILTSPGVFASGWLPTGATPADGDGAGFDLLGVTGRIHCAAVPRFEILSGWDLAGQGGRGQPKTAQRVAPAGSVYWLDNLRATPAQLEALVARGLWPESGMDARRRAEGFNRFSLAAD